MLSTRKIRETFLNSPIPRVSRSAWSYSALHDPVTAKVTKLVPDLFVPQAVQFNAIAEEAHRFTDFFSYGGSMEMYCLGSGESKPSEPASRDKMFFYYKDGLKNTDAFYQAGLSAGFDVIPVVDGRVDGTELITFNKIGVQDAALFADIVTESLFKNDNRIAGAQFDVEPFDVSKEGQAHFYRRIAENFASTAFNCKNEIFPYGRHFSVFTFARFVNPILAEIFNKHQNGYVIDSLYDLEGFTPPNSPEQYAKLVDQEIKSMMAKAREFNIKYQFGIPGSASTYEYESVNGVPTGYKQVDYCKIALEAIERNGARKDPNFMGVNIWGFCHSIHFRREGKMNFFRPTVPNEETVQYLGKHL